MRIRYQASLFANLGFLQPQPKLISSILNRLINSDLNLIPGTFHEITPPDLTAKPRIQFASEAGDLQVNIASGRLDITQLYTSLDGDGLPPADFFVEIVRKCIQAILVEHPLEGARLAFIVQSMMPEQNEDVHQENYRRLFNPPGFFESPSPIEWTFRANSRRALKFSGRSEQSNVILKVERAQGQFKKADGWTPFDRVTSEIDINTAPENSEPRFSAQSLLDFCAVAASLADDIENDLNKKLQGA